MRPRYVPSPMEEHTGKHARATYRLRLWLTRIALERRYDAPPEFSHHPDPREEGITIRLWGARMGSIPTPRSYIPSPYGVLGRILRPSEVSASDVFLDLGCGTGRMLIHAADRYPFRRVIGIDLVPRLVEIARETLERNRDRLRCRDWELVVEDAVHYAVPDDVTVAYLYDPFRGGMFDAVISNLIESYDRNPRRLRIIYFSPKEHERLMDTGRVRFVRFGRRMLRRWEAADYLTMYEIVPASQRP
jgi:SAM-dependent methyltransferase